MAFLIESQLKKKKSWWESNYEMKRQYLVLIFFFCNLQFALCDFCGVRTDISLIFHDLQNHMKGYSGSYIFARAELLIFSMFRFFGSLICTINDIYWMFRRLNQHSPFSLSPTVFPFKYTINKLAYSLDVDHRTD